MKALILMSAGSLLLTTMSCSSGSSTNGTGGVTGMGATTGSGGATTGSGGATTGSGGSDGGSGGSPIGSGGSGFGTGGITSGSGGQTSGSGGMVAAGGTTGTGGGTVGIGGAAGGRTGSGGATGGNMGAGGGTALLSVVGALDGALWTFPCLDRRTGYDCTNVGCVGNPSTATTTKMYPIGGTPGTIYNVTFRVRGVVETYAYVGGTRESGTASVSVNKDLFSKGGTQEPSGNGNDYNTYELDVTPPVAGEANVYYLNSVIASENPHTSVTTQHLTFPIDYTTTIKVPGGGMVKFTSFDSNCALVQNCGLMGANGQCGAPVNVSLAGATPAAANASALQSFVQPYTGMPTNAHGQWVFFDVTDVTTAQ